MEEADNKKGPICKEVLAAWKEVNADTYSEFKNMVDTLLTDTDWNLLKEIEKDGIEEDGIDEETAEDIKSFIDILILLAKGESAIENWYTEAINNRNVFAFCICCYICLDNGLEEIKKGLEDKDKQLEHMGITEGIKGFFLLKAEDNGQEYAGASDKACANESPKHFRDRVQPRLDEVKELNLLTLRRWHYEHPQQYAAFLETVDKAYDGDMTFANKGFNYLMEMLSLGGIKNIMGLILQLIPGTDGFKKRMASSKSVSFHDELNNILNTDLDNEVTRQKILQNNSHFNSTLYWLAFDDGFLKAVELISKTFLEGSNPELIKNIGRNVIKSLILTSFGKAAYTKKQWKNMETGDSRELIASTLMDLKGRRGRRNDCLLLEEIIKAMHTDQIIKAIDNTVSDWKRFDDTDSILAYIYAALQKCELMGGKHAYRTFHNAMVEKFPHHNIKQGYDHAEALFHALTNEGDYNAGISADQIKYGGKQVENICLRFKIIMSPDVSQ
ncbi:MAG: DUF6043 family protein [Prevotella sp.]|nr:DUF6043 family protein [Prevotella sp.]